MRWLLVAILALGLAACSDDDDGDSCGCTGNPVDWDEIALPSELVDGGVWALDASGSRTIGLAVSSSGSWVIEETPDGWVTVGDQPLPRTVDAPIRIRAGATGIVTDVAIDGMGRVQVVGADSAPPRSLIWSEGEPDWIVTEGSTPYGLQAVVALGEEDIVAAGVGSSSILTAVGSAYDTMAFATVSTGGDPGEKGLTDLSEYGGVVYGCGFDDGADGSEGQPTRMIMRYASDEWSLFESPCGNCNLINMRAIEASPFGLHVGGARMVTVSDGEFFYQEENAWFSVFSAQTEEWTEIILPNAEQLRRVNDVLVASDGTVYLACGNEDSAAYLLSMAPGEEPLLEWTGAGLSLFSLVETADGDILAAGLEPGDPAGRPVLIERAK